MKKFLPLILTFTAITIFAQDSSLTQTINFPLRFMPRNGFYIENIGQVDLYSAWGFISGNANDSTSMVIMHYNDPERQTSADIQIGFNVFTVRKIKLTISIETTSENNHFKIYNSSSGAYDWSSRSLSNPDTVINVNKSGRVDLVYYPKNLSSNYYIGINGVRAELYPYYLYYIRVDPIK